MVAPGPNSIPPPPPPQKKKSRVQMQVGSIVIPPPPPPLGVHDQFRLWGLRSSAEYFPPLLARKTNVFAGIRTIIGGCSHPQAPRLVRLCPPPPDSWARRHC